jgi:hypothetical protein
MRERTRFALILAAFAACRYLPVSSERFWGALQASPSLVRWYAREHVLLASCRHSSSPAPSACSLAGAP